MPMNFMGLPVLAFIESAVKLCEHDARDAESFIEGARRIHRVLTGHGVDNEHDLRGLYRIADIFELVHELLVYMQSAGGIEEHEVVAVLFGVLDGCLCDIDGVRRAHLEHGNVELTAYGLELLYRRGAVDIAGGKQWALALLAHVGRELCAVRGLTCALKSDEHDYAR